MPPPPALIEAVTTVVDNTRWRLVLLAGVVGVLSGLVALLHPDATLFVLAACVATYLLALLVARIPGVSVLLGFDAGPRFVRSLLGLLALIGVLLVVDAQLATTLAVVIGFMEYVLLSVAASVAIASRYSGVRLLLAAEAVTVAASADCGRAVGKDRRRCGGNRRRCLPGGAGGAGLRDRCRGFRPPLTPAVTPPPQRVEIVIGVRTLLVLLAFVALVALAVVSLGTLLSIFVAAVVAMGLDPIVSSLQRRGWPRPRAAVVVFASLWAVVLTLVVLTAGPLWREIVGFVHRLPAYWHEVTQTDAFEQITSTTGADHTIRDALQRLAASLPDAAGTLLGIAGGVFGSLLSLVTLSFLALFLVMERPAITNWLFGFTPPDVEARWRPVLEQSIHAVSSSLVGNVAISFVAGAVAGLSAWALGLPFAVVLAVLTGLLDLIPQVGATLAAVVLVAVALPVGTGAAIVMLIVQLIYQQVENYVIYPLVYRHAVELSGLTTIIAVLIAGSMLGVVGAILAVPVAAIIKIVAGEAGAPRRARMAELRSARG